MRKAVLFLSLLILVSCGSPAPDPTGNLTITITGLPAQADANVTVTGPNNYSQAIATTTTLSNLAVGPYTVTATDVTADFEDYIPELPEQAVVVPANATPTVTVAYIPAPPIPPATPTGLVVTVDPSSDPRFEPNQVMLDWDDNPESGVGYNVYRRTATPGVIIGTPHNFFPLAHSHYIDVTAESGVTYYYAVTAVGANNAESPPSDEVSVSVPPDPEE